MASVAGASGLRLQEGGTWTCSASAVILATGGTAFLSRLLGANNNTADGHLMAAEAGARFSGMEFSCYYTVAAANSTMTRSFPFMYGTYRDCDGSELVFQSFKTGLPKTAEALIRGPVTVVLDRMPRQTRERLPHVQPNFLLPLLRTGIDPFKDPFPVTLRGEGTIRGTGGITLADRDCRTGVEGLFAAGDVASRQPIVGAASGGGQPNSAWCVASGTWSGRTAARRAAENPAARRRPVGVPVGRIIGRGRLADADIEEVRRTVSRELNDLDKNMFRTGEGLLRSLTLLDDLWTQVTAQGADGKDADRAALRARETVALVAAGRWVLNSAIVRQESRGMHQRVDAPDRDHRFRATVSTWGLDSVLTEVEPAQRRAAEPVAS